MWDSYGYCTECGVFFKNETEEFNHLVEEHGMDM